MVVEPRYRRTFIVDEDGSNINNSNPFHTGTNQLNGVPTTYTKFMEAITEFPINPGQLNKIGIRPTILNEHQESSGTPLSDVTATNKVIQFFKTSKDNINALFMVAESAATESVVDDIEYAGNNANLQASWVLTGTNLAITEATIVSANKSSTESMRLMMDNADVWTNSFVAADLTGATVEFDFYATKESAKSQLSLSINDGVASSIIPLAVAKVNKDTWQHFSIPIASFVGTANITAITNIFFSVTLTNGGEFSYIDNVRIRPAPGSFDLELWDMGATAPVAGTTKISDGTQYTTLGDLAIGGTQVASVNIGLSGGKKLYHIHEFIAGVAKDESANVLLNINNYYAIVIKHFDTDLTIYGSSGGSDHYTNGFAATAPDNITAVTAIGANQDIMFGIMSTQEVYITKVEIKFSDSTGVATAAGEESELTLFVEDTTETITSYIANEHLVGNTEHEEDLSIRPVLMVDGGKFEAYYNASVSDNIVNSILEIQYLYIPPTVNG